MEAYVYYDNLKLDMMDWHYRLIRCDQGVWTNRYGVPWWKTFIHAQDKRTKPDFPDFEPIWKAGG